MLSTEPGNSPNFHRKAPAPSRTMEQDPALTAISTRHARFWLFWRPGPSIDTVAMVPVVLDRVAPLIHWRRSENDRVRRAAGAEIF